MLKNLLFSRFLKDKLLFLLPQRSKKSFSTKTKVRNVFRDINLPLGHNIMTLRDVLLHLGRVKQKLSVKKTQNTTYEPLFGGVLLKVLHRSFSHATQTSTRNSTFNVIWKKSRNLLPNHVEY